VLEGLGPGTQRFVVSGLSEQELKTLKDAGEAKLGEIFNVYANLEPGESRLPMLGETKFDGDKLVLTPRFPLEPGVNYHVVLRRPTAGEGRRRAISQVFSLPKPITPRAEVSHVYPSAKVLPENQLKFYLHFSRPMSRGDAYQHVTLLDSDGQPVERPFLELGEELWDRTGTRFTLYFDPGRIKRGLKPREIFGPALEEGQSYTLVIAPTWRDADGQPLAAEYRKPFRVVAPDDEQPFTAKWRVAPPAAQLRAPLDVRFPEPLDHAMLLRVLHVVNEADEPIPGEITVSENETRWQFTPDEPWQAGNYRLVIDSALEDLAGNSIRRPFEVDMARPVETEEVIETVSVPFRVTPEISR
jgi:hypothetical protein